jgi:transaldolase/glucose-6-phosphate isomerase
LREGQSVWLDFIRRGILQSGDLARMVREGLVTGVTSNPSIFEKAIAGSTDYAESLHEIALRGVRDPYEAFVEIAVADIQGACDALRPAYDAADGADGFVSFEIPPGIEVSTPDTVAEATRLWNLVSRPNLMIKVPGTPEGLAAAAELITGGININITLLFGLRQYEATAEAYLRGLERRLPAPIGRVASVASFFVSRLDTAIDPLLPEGSPLRGKSAVANARVAYKRFQAIFSGPRWEALAAAGARVQRPLWASTGTKNPAYSDILYVEELIAPHTVNTVPEATLAALLDHLDVRPTLVPGIPAAEAQLAALPAAGVDLDAVTDRLLVEGLAAFEKDFLKLLARVETTLARERVGPPAASASLGGLGPAVTERLATLARDRVVERIWSLDHTVWKPDPAEIADRLEWLTVVGQMKAEAAGLAAFAREVAADGFTDAVVLGMGGSSLAPEVLRATFGIAPGMLELHVLDSTDPSQILDLERRLDLEKTLFIVSSKSGGTIETRSQWEYFWAKLPKGSHYIAITDAGSSLEAAARARDIRRVFLNPPGIGGRYSALSFFGLVPAVLIGVGLDRLLAGAADMMHACGATVAPSDNPGAWLGAVLGEGALAGRDKVTLVLPDSFATLGYWIEQLVAESMGKEGRGILPVEGEALGAPSVYGDDRLFVALGDHPELAALEMAGHPVVRLACGDAYQLGPEFFRWEFATAVAGQILRLNPFDQPNVQEAKDLTAEVLAGRPFDDASLTLADALASVETGDYIAINAYLNRNAGNIATLDRIRLAVRDRFRVATTVGFGPRFLHSTGQLHKGGPGNGVFLQVVDDDPTDLAIPGKPYTFRALQAAQALGDLASLKAHGRRVARVRLADLEAL